MIQPPDAPLRFDPICQYRLWGGRHLADWLAMPLPGDDPIGEAWLLSDRDDNPSRVSDGPLKGHTLADLIEAFPGAILGNLAPHFKHFPLLLKYLDVSAMLSVQVHPPADRPELIPDGETAKTEGWVVLSAEPQSRIYPGLRPGVTVGALRSLSQSTVDDLLPSFPAIRGQSVLIEAGNVHSLGDGVVVLEVQQNSDVTFRLFDWDHVDPATGHPRPLQVEHALRCVNLAQGIIGPTSPQIESTEPVQRERLLDSPHFRLWRSTASVPYYVGTADTPSVLVCIEGTGTVFHDDQAFPMVKGEVMLLPAVIGACQFHPDDEATLIEIIVPPA